MAPLSVVGATLLAHAVVLDVAGYQETKATAIALKKENQNIASENQALQKEIGAFQNRQNYLIATLGQTNSQLSELSKTVDLRIAANASEEDDDILSEFRLTQSALEGFSIDLDTKLNAEVLNPQEDASLSNESLPKSVSPNVVIADPLEPDGLQNAVVKS